MERTIQAVKNVLKKSFKCKEDPHLVLLAFRTTPGCGGTRPPAELLMNRHISTNLPQFALNLPSHPPTQLINHQVRHHQQGCELPKLKVGDHVCILMTAINGQQQALSFRSLTSLDLMFFSLIQKEKLEGIIDINHMCPLHNNKYTFIQTLDQEIITLTNQFTNLLHKKLNNTKRQRGKTTS